MIYIGIDTGKNTGIAIWSSDDKKLVSVETKAIHKAMRDVLRLYEIYNGDVFVRFEDARQRHWVGNTGRERLQGAGSIKRDSQIWDDFLSDYHIPFSAVPPKNNHTKIKPDAFARITGWMGRTSEHSRDAAMLVFGI